MSPGSVSHWTERNTWGCEPRFSPSGYGAEVRRPSALRGAGLPELGVGSGGEKVGRVTWAGWGWRGAAGDVAFSRVRARDLAE